MASSPESKAPTAHWLAGSLPGWTPLGNESAAQALRQPRYLSDSGRLFFNSADPLVSVEHATSRQETINGETASVGVENVYEYQPAGLGSCKDTRGCVALLSSGTSQQESAFLDASTSGNDAFFLSSQPLVAQDHDTSFDLYDARVCTSQSPCVTSEGAASQPCESTNTCRPPTPPATTGQETGTATFTGPGNPTRQEDLTAKETVKPPGKPPTAKQKTSRRP